MSPRRERLFVLNDPHAMRISAALAMEVGLNESIVLLQLEFLISISDHVHEGRIWTYQSLTELQQSYFPFWSRATINRAIKSLVERELLSVGNFNRAGFDKTSWYAINPKGIARLASIRLATAMSHPETATSQIETPASHNETSVFQSSTSASQDGPTIPETTAETPPEKGYWDKTLEEWDAVEAEIARNRNFVRRLGGRQPS